MATSNVYCLGLGSKFTGVVIAAVLATGILVSGAMLYEGHNRLRDQIIDNNEVNVTLAAEFARDYVSRVQESFEFQAKSPIITHALDSGNYLEVAPFLREFLGIHAEINNCRLYDADGINRASGASTVSHGSSRADREWFKQIVDTGKPILGEGVVSPVTGRPGVAYAVPVLNGEGVVQAVVLGSISLSTLSQTITRLRPGPIDG
jgi:hypothetical protein